MRRASLILLLATVGGPGAPADLPGLGDRAAAQVIQGRIFAYDTGAPLRGAAVALMDADSQAVATTLADSSGAFRLRVPAPGAWRVAVAQLGYGSVLSAPIDVGLEATVSVEIRMAVAPVALDDPVVVVGERTYRNPDLEAFRQRRKRGERTGRGYFIGREELERRPGARPTDLFRTIAGVRIVRGGRGRGDLVQMRGGCSPAIYIDGMQINRLMPNESLDTYVSIESIEGIEVYKGAQLAGAYHDAGGCGLILVWTRRGTTEGHPFSWARLLVLLGIVAGILLLR